MEYREGNLDRDWKPPQLEVGAGSQGKPRQLEFAGQNSREESHTKRMLEICRRPPPPNKGFSGVLMHVRLPKVRKGTT